MNPLADDDYRPELLADPDEHVRATVRWHFDPATGSPFWLGVAKEFGLDPIEDVRTAADLDRLPDVDDRLRTTPVADLVPAGLAGRPFLVFESGGTTGAPKRVVENSSRAQCVGYVGRTLAAHGFPGSGHWLHVGPTGPHAVGRSVAMLAEQGGGMCFHIDLDPRWVKRVTVAGRRDVAADYVEHVLDQVELVLTTQEVTNMFLTPPLLEALCARERLHERAAATVRGLLWAGTTMSPATLRLVEEHYFPDTTVASIYGNTLMGIAPQRPPRPDDPSRCVYRNFWPHSLVRVLDPDTGAEVAHGERGQVVFHLLTRDMFLPRVAERDGALRVAPPPGDHVDGVADIAPLAAPGAEAPVEGVY